MPGYYDWKIRNCTAGAQNNANLLMETMEMVDGELHKLWEAGEGSFTPEVNEKLAAIVHSIDVAEEKLEKAKLSLAEFFSGHP